MLKSTTFRDIDSLAKQINHLYESIFKKYGLQRGQFIFITRIAENKSISLKDLATSLRVDKTTVTKAIQKLETAGYVKKTQDQTDSRLFHLLTTPKGLAMYQQIIKEKNQILASVLDEFSAAEIKLLSSLVQRMDDCIARIKK